VFREEEGGIARVYYFARQPRGRGLNIHGLLDPRIRNSNHTLRGPEVGEQGKGTLQKEHVRERLAGKGASKRRGSQDRSLSPQRKGLLGEGDAPFCRSRSRSIFGGPLRGI